MRARRSYGPLGAALALSALLNVIGCSDDDDPGCPKFEVACDIRRVTCQRQIFAATACARGQSGARMPSIRAITRAQYADELREESSMDDDFGERAWGNGLALFGLVPRDQTYDEASIAQQVENVAAFYRRSEKDVTILVDGTLGAEQGTFTLSHEFVHALQDQREGLDPFFKAHVESSDDNLALRSLVEGEAVLLSNLTQPDLAGRDSSELDWDRYFDSGLMDTLRSIASAEAPFFATRSLVYPVGGRGVAKIYVAHGLSGIAELYGKPLTTFRSWTLPQPTPMPPEPMDCELPEPPPGYALRYRDRLGMAGLIALYSGLDEGALFDEAHAWVADMYGLYAAEAEDSDDVAVAWRIRFGSSAAADRFVIRVNRTSAALVTEQSDQEVLLTAASTPELFAAWDIGHTCRTKGRSPSAPEYRIPESVRRWSGHGAH